MTMIVRNAPKQVKVALLAYDGAQMSAVLGLGDILTVANRYAGDAGGVCVVDHTVLHPGNLETQAKFDAVVLPPNLTGTRGEQDEATHAWISGQHRRGALLCSACAGAFWLGHAGALDGRPVTTHWALEADFRAAFPNADLHPEHLLIDDNDIVTAGGVMAWVDLGLFLVRRWMGPEIVSQTCRHMLIDPQGREQRNYRSFRPRLDHGDHPIRDLQHWMEENAAIELTLPSLALKAGMTERTFQRRFTQATGLPVTRYIQELRVEKARGYLERTIMPVSEICWLVGYTDTSAFSRLFRSICGVSAREYRRRFAVA
ncbi:MAG: helix-turn-helix domain-containing protein [Aliishimia sp.]